MPHAQNGDYEVWTVSYGSTRYLARVRKCATYGEYKGEMRSSGIGEVVALPCLCDGPVCPKCGQHKKYPRGSLSMDKNGRIWHMLGYPYFATCSDCWNKGQAERQARMAQASEAGEGSRQSTASPAKPTPSDGRDWIKFVDECFPPGPEPKGPFSEE